MQHEIRFATFNALNLAPPRLKLYDNLAVADAAEVEAKLDWTARQLDLIDADVIGFQEIFSQSALKEVLARTRRYRDATHVGVEMDPAAERKTPSVALVSRLPLAGPTLSCPQFPAGITLPPGSLVPERFARPVLHVCVQASHNCAIDVLVVHLKSKRPDYHNGDSADDPLLHALASLRSVVWRATEALALHVMQSNMARTRHLPRVVLGDFNDVADADSLTIITGAKAAGPARLFDAYAVQTHQARDRERDREREFSHIHEGRKMTIDHILVSEQFNGAGPNVQGEVLEVRYFNEHLLHETAGASDHGQVLARIGLHT